MRGREGEKRTGFANEHVSLLSRQTKEGWMGKRNQKVESNDERKNEKKDKCCNAINSRA
jgi:hypothetical protein